ncbi:MAG: hypothetical protein DDT22_01280 [candidate division WS2 bacterium]|nr:hypothetical protein [Candidatus Lithacetigena glycinireducens]
MRKILVSLSIIGVIGALAIGGTIAYFSDVETSAGNTFTAGTLDLEISGYANWKFPITDATPGYDSGVMTILIKMADGSNAPNHLEIDVDTHSFVDWAGESGGTNSKDDFKKQIEVKRLWYYNASAVNLLSLVNDNADGKAGFISLFDVEAYGVFDNLPTIGTGAGGLEIRLALPTDLPDANDNKYQGDSIRIDFEFGVAQVAGQNVLTN